MTTLKQDAEVLSQRVRHLVNTVKDNLAQSIVKRLPKRVLYFAVIRAIAVSTSGPERGTIEVPGITAMDVAKALEV